MKSGRPVERETPQSEPLGCAGWVYGLAIVGYNNQATPRYVYGFNLTALDYFAAICYDPEIQGYLDETCTVNGEGALGYQEDRGFADWIPAEVYNQSISGYQPDRNFTSLGEHWVRDWLYGTRFYSHYTGVCIRTPPDFCELKTENGNMAVPCPTPVITPTPSPSPTPPTVQIQEVGFTGDETIRRYSSNLPNPPQYVDNPDGSTPTWVRNGSNNSANYVAYQKGTDPKVFARLSISPVAATSVNALVRVKRGGQEITAQNTAVTLSANSSMATLSNVTIRASVLESISETNPAKPKKATYDFDWEISLDNGQTWRLIGVTQHTVFWTYGDVVESPTCDSDNGSGNINRDCLFVNNTGRTEFPGLYDLALEKALGDPQFNSEIGSANPNEMPDKIARFLAKKIDDQIDYNASVITFDPLHPLRAYSAPDGVQCSVNANLLRGLLRSIGVRNAETVYVWGGKPDNNEKRESLNGGLTYGYKVTYIDRSVSPPRLTDFHYSFQAIRPENNESSFHLPKDPHFTFHAMVKVFNEPDGGPSNLNARYYDPSYAKRLEANPTRYSDYPYVNSNLRYRKAADLDDPDPRRGKFVDYDATKPFVVRALSLNNFCLPNNRTCPVSTTIKRGSLPVYIAALPKTSVFDAQGSAIFAVWRPANGTWYMHNPYVGTFASREFGIAGDLLTPGDYDGDGVTDYLVFRPSNATRYVFDSADPGFRVIPWNSGTDLPILGDFDGDGKNDIAYYKEATESEWHITPSTTGLTYTETFGIPGDKPISGDFDGDGRTDIAVFRPSTGTWYWRRSIDGVMYSRDYGVNGDIIVPGDYDADGVTDFVVYRPSNNHWYVLLPASNIFYGFQMGSSGDIPVPGEYDGDLKSDFALWSPSTGKWTVQNSDNGSSTEAYWGVSGDRPVGAAFSY